MGLLQYPALAQFRQVVADNAAERNKPKPQPTKYEKKPQEYPTDYSDARVGLIKKLWADGLSASAIATRVGNITRNAVIGKVHRLGLPGRSPRKPARTTLPPRPRAIILKPVTPPRPAQILIPVLDETPNVGYKLTDLTERMCHWPNGDPMLPGFSFCGAPKEFSTPYCPHHDHIAHRKPERKSKGKNGFYWLDLEKRNRQSAAEYTRAKENSLRAATEKAGE